MDPAAWLFLAADAVPAGWRDRSRPCALVPLSGVEVATLLREQSVLSVLDDTDVRLLRLLARGRTVSAVARELGVSRSTVQRRTARLRERLGAESLVDLALAAARHGFA